MASIKSLHLFLSNVPKVGGARANWANSNIITQDYSDSIKYRAIYVI